VYRGEFDPYGQTLLETGSTTLNSQKFTGYEKDQTTGLDYANARMYSGSRGRFASPDPAGMWAANRARPQSLNRYAYTQSDPVNFVDGSGMFLYNPPLSVSSPVKCTFMGGAGYYCPVPPLVPPPPYVPPSTPPGGPGGTPEPPPPQKTREEIVAEKRKSAIALARRALQSPQCKDFLKGSGFDGDPIDLLDILDLTGQFNEGRSDFFYGPNADPTAYMVTRGIGINAQIDVKPELITSERQSSGTYDMSNLGLRLRDGGITGNMVLSEPHALALMMLHELGHATGRYTEGSSQRHDEKIGNTELSQGVFTECILPMFD
jgi:RHS repeat-associated protein